MKIAAIALISLSFLTGCETAGHALDFVGDVCSIFTPADPVPEPGPQNAGVIVQGNVCVRMSDGSWQWVPVRRSSDDR